jgi:hypothetical protein
VGIHTRLIVIAPETGRKGQHDSCLIATVFEIEAAHMDEDINNTELKEPPADASRRAFIKGGIGSGTAACSDGYLFRSGPLATALLAQTDVGERLIAVNVNGQMRRVDAPTRRTTGSSRSAHPTCTSPWRSTQEMRQPAASAGPGPQRLSRPDDCFIPGLRPLRWLAALGSPSA